MPTKSDLRQMQSLPLSAKIVKTQQRIREWYNHFDGDVYISFSGGKDSTVLADLVHDIFPDVPLVFDNTGLEYPEIQKFAREKGAEFIRPKMPFSEVISKYGYPIISKEVCITVEEARTLSNTKNARIRRAELDGTRTNPKTGELSPFQHKKWKPLCTETQFCISENCCKVMKKAPMKTYETKTKRKAIIGTLTEESRLREFEWIKHGCNSYDGKKKTSKPMSFWTEQNVLQYIRHKNLRIASVYGDIVGVDGDGMEYDPLPGVECQLKCSGCYRTGCLFCGFGVYLEKGETRFQRIARTHPKQYEYCMRGGQWVDNPKYDPTAPAYDGEWKNWNPKKIWVPSKEGLGMRKVFEDCNQIYGKDFIRYE